MRKEVLYLQTVKKLSNELLLLEDAFFTKHLKLRVLRGTSFTLNGLIQQPNSHIVTLQANHTPIERVSEIGRPMGRWSPLMYLYSPKIGTVQVRSDYEILHAPTAMSGPERLLRTPTKASMENCLNRCQKHIDDMIND